MKTAVRTAVEITVPVLDEERALEQSVLRLREFLNDGFDHPYAIAIVDNGSSDRTPEIGARLAEEISEVTYRRLERPGRGRALRAAWSQSEAEVLCYMDVDLSTGLEALAPLVEPLISGESDLAIGPRLAPGSSVIRGPGRELISRAYNSLLHLALGARISDAQCGFKAGRAEAIRSLLPQVEDDAWFFDTELLILAERADMRIHEIPVNWVEDPDSRVAIVPTAVRDLVGVARLVGEPLLRRGG